jgi:hypothetical protein
MTATTLRLGYLDSGILFAVLFIVPALGYRFVGLNAVIAFWLAYILTRPFGASFADWIGRPRDLSGLGLGTGSVSLVLTLVIVGLVAYVSLGLPLRPTQPGPGRSSGHRVREAFAVDHRRIEDRPAVLHGVDTPQPEPAQPDHERASREVAAPERAAVEIDGLVDE